MQIFEWDGSKYLAQFGRKTHLEYDAVTDEFTLTRINGAQAVFFGLSGGSSGGGGGSSSSSSSGGIGAPAGALSKMISAGGGETGTSYEGELLTKLERKTGSGANLNASTLHFTYTGGRRSKVQHELTRDGTTTEVRRVTYTYYGASDPGGSEGDLATTLTESFDGSNWVSRGKRCLRYFKTGDPDLGADGFVHGLKYFLGPEMYKQITESVGAPESLASTTTNEEALAAFANYVFKYDPATKRVKQIRRKGVTA